MKVKSPKKKEKVSTPADLPPEPAVDVGYQAGADDYEY